MNTNPSSFFQHGYVDTGDVMLHYAQCGQGKPLLLLPGWPQSWYAWRKVMPRLAASGRRVVAIDPRGLGDSSKPAQGYDLANIARDLHEFATKQGLLEGGPLDVAGHDVGAWIGYAWAVDYRQDIRRLALYDAALPGITPAPPGGVPSEMANERTWHFGFNRLQDLPEKLVAGHERVYLNWLFRTKLRDPAAIASDDLDEYVRIFSAPDAARAGFDYYRALFNDGGLERNRQRAQQPLTLPVMAWGASDGVGDKLLETMRQVAESVTGGVIEACGHYIPEEAPEVVSRQMTLFFSD